MIRTHPTIEEQAVVTESSGPDKQVVENFVSEPHKRNRQRVPGSRRDLQEKRAAAKARRLEVLRDMGMLRRFPDDVR
jgi:hypothetical protein